MVLIVYRSRFLSSSPPNVLTASQIASLDNADGVIDFCEFELLCLKKLKFDLSAVELRRIFDKLTAGDEPRLSSGNSGELTVGDLRDGGEDGDGDTPRVPQERTLTFERFVKGVRRRGFLLAVVSNYSAVGAANAFVMPADYDYTGETNANYSAPVEAGFVGEFQELRAERDYGYHVNYTPERQRWQDEAVRSVVMRTNPQPRPWVVYTCGAMGTGKGCVVVVFGGGGVVSLVHSLSSSECFVESTAPRVKARERRLCIPRPIINSRASSPRPLRAHPLGTSCLGCRRAACSRLSRSCTSTRTTSSASCPSGPATSRVTPRARERSATASQASYRRLRRRSRCAAHSTVRE